MKKYLMLFILLLTLLPACSYSKFIVTGTPREPLSEDSDIQYMPEGEPSAFDQIGIAEIKNSDKDYRLNEAKRLARLYGGKIIIPGSKERNKKTENFYVFAPVQKEITSDQENISKKPEPAEEKKPEKSEKPELPKPAEKTKPDYSGVPGVPYAILAGEYSNLIGEKFKGIEYAKRIIGFPGELYKYSKGNSLVELSSKKGGEILYLIIKNEYSKKFQQSITSKKGIKIVYTPVALYRSQYPVIEFIDFYE